VHRCCEEGEMFEVAMNTDVGSVMLTRVLHPPEQECFGGNHRRKKREEVGWKAIKARRGDVKS